MSMQIPASVARTQPEPSLGAEIGQRVCLSPCAAAFGAASGYLGTLAFTAINPLLGAAFSATYVPIAYITRPIFEKFISSKDHPNLAGLLSWTVTVITSATLAKVLLGAAGISLTAGNVAAIIAANFVVGIIFSVAVIVAALVGLSCCCCFCPDQFEEIKRAIKEQQASGLMTA